jgi:hypothetical protein
MKKKLKKLAKFTEKKKKKKKKSIMCTFRRCAVCSALAAVLLALMPPMLYHFVATGCFSRVEWAVGTRPVPRKIATVNGAEMTLARFERERHPGSPARRRGAAACRRRRRRVAPVDHPLHAAALWALRD